jgi:cephalosporin hydroxylase
MSLTGAQAGPSLSAGSGVGDGQDIPKLLTELERRVRDKIRDEQATVPTYFDNLVLQSIAYLAEPSGAERPMVPPLALLLTYRAETSKSRFAPYAERAAQSRSRGRLPWEIDRVVRVAGQGVGPCFTWKNLPLFKTVFDFAVYPMLLWEARPGTVLEFGSGAGASAIWLADLLRMFAIEAPVISVDLRKPAIDYPGVEFLEGDCNDVGRTFPQESLAQFRHPWIVIQDVSVDPLPMMNALSEWLVPGDYIVIEDSRSSRKQRALASFCENNCGRFLVDTRYTDFFGRNTTCSADSILVRV